MTAISWPIGNWTSALSFARWQLWALTCHSVYICDNPLRVLKSHLRPKVQRIHRHHWNLKVSVSQCQQRGGMSPLKLHFQKTSIEIFLLHGFSVYLIKNINIFKNQRFSFYPSWKCLVDQFFLLGRVLKILCLCLLPQEHPSWVWYATTSSPMTNFGVCYQFTLFGLWTSRLEETTL